MKTLRPNLMARLGKHWCSLPGEAVKSPAWEGFKNR